MTSRLTSMQAQFRRKQEDDREHRLLAQGQGSRQPGGSVSRIGGTAPGPQRNGFLPSIQNKTAPQPMNSRSGAGTRSNSAPRPVPSALRPAYSASASAPLSASRPVPVAVAVATKPKTIVHKITLTAASSNSASNGPASPRVGLDRSATYSKPTIGTNAKVTGSTQNRSQSQTRTSSSRSGRMDENGNELMTPMSSRVGTGSGIGDFSSKPKPFSTASSLAHRQAPSATAVAIPSSADLTKRLAGLNLGERKAPVIAVSRSAPAPMPNRRPPASATTAAPSRPRPTISTATPRQAPPRTRAPVSSSARAPAPASASARQRQPLTKKATPPPGSVACSQCGRHFASDRIEKHEMICKKTAAKKRKVFDPTKMRMKGTEAEPYLKVVVASTRKVGSSGAGGSAAAAKSNWRKKHEDFIRTIRLAKEYNAHVAAGGNPADLPPPPPSDYSDYVQCPHCGRKFSEGAASRHIPKCSSIKSNKR